MMISRYADCIYWLNRYVERADNVARFIDVNLNLMMDFAAAKTEQWLPLVLTTGDLEIFQARYGEATAENVIRFLAFDGEYPSSIISCLNMARENARSIRAIIFSEVWEELNSYCQMVRDAQKRNQPQLQESLSEFFNNIRLANYRFIGVMDNTMTHDEAWLFGTLGRLLERADKTARILDVKYFYLLPSAEWVGTPLDQVQWIALLKSASGYEMYRKFQHRITPSGVVDFLILNRMFPRSLYFCLLQIQQFLHQINNTPVGSWSNSAERELGRLCAELSYITVEDIIEEGLHEFLDRMQAAMNKVGDSITETFFWQVVEAS